MIKSRIVFYHILAWTIFYSLPLFTTWSGSAAVVKMPRPPDLFWVSSLFQILIFYTTVYWLMPRYFFQKRYGQFIAGALGVLALRTIVLGALPFPEQSNMDLPPMPKEAMQSMRNFFLFFPGLVTIAFSMGFSLIIEHRRKEALYKEKETINLRSELRFLHSQISPHFLFNVLNSLTALARKKSDLLEPSLLKLSELMRYTIYETDQAYISLEHEVDYIESYVDLQQLRFDEHFRLHINIEKTGLPQQRIAPMLLMPLIENAFKFSSQMVESPYIELDLRLVESSRLVLTLVNSYSNDQKQENLGVSNANGLGLSNLQRRLELIYPQRFKFTTQRRNHEFIVNLEIELSDSTQQP
jgi:two-component system, LytTR family, sensor kinase